MNVFSPLRHAAKAAFRPYFSESVRIPSNFDSLYVANVSSAARKAVLDVFAAKPDAVGLSTQEIWEESLEQIDLPVPPVSLNPSPQLPPGEWHPLRSVRNLKKYVLPQMEEERRLMKVHVKIAEDVREEDGTVTRQKVFVDGEEFITTPVRDTRYGTKVKDVWIWRLMDEKEWIEREEKLAAKKAKHIERERLDEEARKLWKQTKNDPLLRGQYRLKQQLKKEEEEFMIEREKPPHNDLEEEYEHSFKLLEDLPQGRHMRPNRRRREMPDWQWKEDEDQFGFKSK
ncbi:uncharacterized protein LAESUDRAFT_222637 [Laetiporus sulphureus 93-53]|uniref:Uncharacterized protein n=1 Tax=Laetiporus sulphureus 93-53 TaxID=1314785 RepID=A0A165DTL0_9APHY|nr:uncharacterized protein LAESUDRAFT_222637 [Laetiporus sulphureus 93-53]KZT05607.1 hypothetical protein LAESUDRAFT_222637 [Laetiporus sulphureus 93-53]